MKRLLVLLLCVFTVLPGAAEVKPEVALIALNQPAEMLCDLLPYYKTYDKARYEWLITTLRSAIKQASLPLEEEKKFMKMLDK